MSVSLSVSAPARRGLLPLVAAGVLWGTGGLLGALVQHRTGLAPIAVATYRLGVGGAALLAFPAATTGLALTPTPANLLAVTVLGLAPTAVAYALFFHGLPAAGAATAAILTLLEPLTATLLAVVLLGERLTPVAWTGAALLATALVLTATTQERTASLPDGRNPQGSGKRPGSSMA